MINWNLKKCNRKGKEYNFNIIIIFEGESKKGNRHKKEIEYNENGIIKYDGKYLNEIRHRKGK